MKFGTLLRNSAAETPELQSLFVCYKHLKKRLKRLPERHAEDQGNNQEDVSDEMAQRQRNFVLTLNEDVQQFNELFMEKEEDSVIQLRTLEDAAKEAHDVEAISRVFKAFVDFHGQMLLLVHWSILAYTGLVKILKKHHKRTGLLVRAPHLDNLLSQPFCSVELMTELVRKAEQNIDSLAAQLRNTSGPAAAAAISASGPGQQSPTAAVNDLIHAARSSVEEIAGSEVDVSSSEEENSVEAGDGQAEDEGDELQQPCAEVASRNGIHESIGRGKRKLTRSLDMSSNSITSSRRGRLKTGNETSGTMVSASPVNPSMLAAATAAHQASLQVPTAPDTSAIGPLCATAAPASGSSLGDRSPTQSSAEDDFQQPQHQLVRAPGSSPAPPDTADGLGHEHAGVLHEAASSASLSGTAQPVPEHTPSILRQTAAALGLWEQLHETASTPSTVLSSQAARMRAAAAQAALSASTDQSAA
ncbi:probable SPX domain-containing protein 1 at N-terminal half [Coccomyxa sp. Obi]|nr:probable SPX domain-containing protein 1 at N-terminal half [Coccomyxa sp. Obi]